MKRWLDTVVLGGGLVVGTALVPGCMVGEPVDDEVVLAAKNGKGNGGGVSQGAQLFNTATFGGNGRTCATCHPSEVNEGDTGTLSPADVEALYQADPGHPLFQHDGADVFGGDTFDRLRAHATILVEIALPPNVSIAGSDADSVVVRRGIPTTMNVPALDPVLMFDGRDPTLQAQALGAIQGHAQTADVTAAELDAIAGYQQTLFNRQNVEDFAQDGVPLAMPQGTTESEQRGRRFFLADDETDPAMNGSNGTQLCGICHSGPTLDQTSEFFGTDFRPGVPTGTRFFTVLVSELNPLGNPVYDFEFTNPDGTVTTITSPDPGRALITGNPAQANFFKINTVWGISETAPYFHDNSAKTLEDLVEHYDQFFNAASGGVLDLSEQDKVDLVAYMKLL